MSLLPAREDVQIGIHMEDIEVDAVHVHTAAQPAEPNQPQQEKLRCLCAQSQEELETMIETALAEYDALLANKQSYQPAEHMVPCIRRSQSTVLRRT